MVAAGHGVGAFLGESGSSANVTHWAPWTTYIGLGIGLSAAVLAVLRTVRNFSRVIAAEEAAGAAEAAGPGRGAAALPASPEGPQ